MAKTIAGRRTFKNEGSGESSGRENYIEHHHGEVNLVFETDQNDIEYAREEKYDETIFIENNDSVVIHDIKSGYTNRCPISDICYTGMNQT